MSIKYNETEIKNFLKEIDLRTDNDWSKAHSMIEQLLKENHELDEISSKVSIALDDAYNYASEIQEQIQDARRFLNL